MRNPVTRKPPGAAAPPPGPGIPAEQHPSPSTCPAQAPAPPLAATLDPETRALLIRFEATLDRLARAQLTEADLRAIEDRAVERLAPLTLTVMKYAREAARAAEAYPAHIQKAGEAMRQEVTAAAETAKTRISEVGDTAHRQITATAGTADRQMIATAKMARAMVRRTGRHVRKEASTHMRDIARSMYGRMRAAARDMLRELTAATEPAQTAAKALLAIAPGVEAAAVTIADMAPPATQAMEIRMRKIARETVLTMLTGLALLVLVGATAAVRIGLQL